MQPRTAPPREGLTADQVEALISAPSVEVSAGLERVDARGVTVEDISDRLVGGRIRRNNYATIHGTAELELMGAPLEWGRDRVRPFMVLRSGDIEARFDLGVYFLSTPERTVGPRPETYRVECYDALLALRTLTGETVYIPEGTNVVQAVRDLLDEHAAGARFLIPYHEATLPSPRLWVVDEETTWLHVVNDLLGLIGYRGLWADWNGTLRSDVYRAPADSGVEWVYSADDVLTIVGEDRTVIADFFDAPNRWVFVRHSPADGTSEPEVAGVYEVINRADGPSSVEGRGRVITYVEFVDVVDDDALRARGDAVVDRDRHIDTGLTLRTEPNPLHWHFDVVTYHDAAMGVDVKAVSHEWELPLDGSQMTHRLRKV